MACINIKIDRIGEALSLAASRIGGLLFWVSRKDEPLKVEVEDVLKNQHLYVTCGVLCAVNSDSYLRVTPDAIWLASGVLDGAEFNIYANVTWEIK